MAPARKGSFYILQSTIYFNLVDGGLGHPFFWKQIVRHLFKKLDGETMRELREACYGTDRGRVTIDDAGVVRLLGTPGCKPHRKILLELFNLKGLKGVVLNFNDDEHYKTLKSDVGLVQDALKFEGLKKPKQVSIIQYVEGGQFVKRR
jgi:hypothetical protein